MYKVYNANRVCILNTDDKEIAELVAALEDGHYRTIVEKPQPKKIKVRIRCPFCSANSFVAVNVSDLDKWQKGALASVCFPYLSANEREKIISGLCDHCQNEMFG